MIHEIGGMDTMVITCWRHSIRPRECLRSLAPGAKPGALGGAAGFPGRAGQALRRWLGFGSKAQNLLSEVRSEAAQPP